MLQSCHLQHGLDVHGPLPGAFLGEDDQGEQQCRDSRAEDQDGVPVVTARQDQNSTSGPGKHHDIVHHQGESLGQRLPSDDGTGQEPGAHSVAEGDEQRYHGIPIGPPCRHRRQDCECQHVDG